jgi:hypothetical protein
MTPVLVFCGCHNKVQQTGALTWRNFWSSGGWKFKIKEPAGFASEVLLLAFRWWSSHCLHVTISLCRIPGVASFYKDTNDIGLEPTLVKTSYLLRVPISKSSHWGGRRVWGRNSVHYSSQAWPLWVTRLTWEHSPEMWPYCDLLGESYRIPVFPIEVVHMWYWFPHLSACWEGPFLSTALPCTPSVAIRVLPIPQQTHESASSQGRGWRQINPP